MKKVTLHHHNSVSEYFLNSNMEIKEVKHLLNNRTKSYVYNEHNPVYHSLISLFEDKNLTSNVNVSKKRTINEYRQNKDNFYALSC